jgi:hypothetical protein
LLILKAGKFTVGDAIYRLALVSRKVKALLFSFLETKKKLFSFKTFFSQYVKKIVFNYT